MRALIKRKLTPLDGSKLRARSRTFIIWDTQERGLALRVRPSGHKSFLFVYRHRGRSRWITIGNADTVSLAAAREQALQLRLAVHQGQDPASTRATSTGTTFAIVAGRYVAEYAKKRNKSWKQASTLITRYVIPSVGTCDPSTITRSDVRALLAKIDAPVLANQILASTSAIFTWASRQEILSNNPCRGIERNTTVSRERVLSDAELPLFWEAFGEAGIPGLVLKVLLLTGQRPGEVSHMHHSHIKDNWWEMPGKPEAATQWPGTKNGESHRVWLPAKVQAIIADLSGPNDPLNGPNGPLDVPGFVFGTVPNLDGPMRDICKALSVPRATPHDLRRTHGTTIAALGFGKDAMNRIQNHKEGGIASVYDRHQYAQENIRVMETVASRIVALAEHTTPASNVVPLALAL